MRMAVVVPGAGCPPVLLRGRYDGYPTPYTQSRVTAAQDGGQEDISPGSPRIKNNRFARPKDDHPILTCRGVRDLLRTNHHACGVLLLGVPLRVVFPAIESSPGYLPRQWAQEFEGVALRVSESAQLGQKKYRGS